MTCPSEFAQDHVDLGGTLNGYSLSEAGSLSAAIEKTGQAVDANYLATSNLVSRLCTPRLIIDDRL